jgi:hypothetical protein
VQVCVGAACPEERLHLLLHLLEPSGGKLLAPVDSDLRLYTRSADGSVKHRLVSSVRFSDLEVRGGGMARVLMWCLMCPTGKPAVHYAVDFALWHRRGVVGMEDGALLLLPVRERVNLKLR